MDRIRHWSLDDRRDGMEGLNHGWDTAMMRFSCALARGTWIGKPKPWTNAYAAGWNSGRRCAAHYYHVTGKALLPCPWQHAVVQ